MSETLSCERTVESGPIRCSSWRTLLSPPLSGAENMACDLALMDRARRTDEAVLRIYSWKEPTLSFGRNQKASGYDRDALARAGLAVVRRPTGGRAILHHREITYSVTAPAATGESIAAAYDWINGLLLRALRSLGVQAMIATPSSRAPAPDANPCFAEPSAGEITHGGRKLVGSAQYREAGAMLQHGSILISDDQSSLAALAGGGAVPAPATLELALGRAPQPAELHDALLAALREDGIEPRSLPSKELTDPLARHLAAFEDSQWTWRR
jgi:lipoate-protein ligase A